VKTSGVFYLAFTIGGKSIQGGVGEEKRKLREKGTGKEVGHIRYFENRGSKLGGGRSKNKT